MKEGSKNQAKKQKCCEHAYLAQKPFKTRPLLKKSRPE